MKCTFCSYENEDVLFFECYPAKKIYICYVCFEKGLREDSKIIIGNIHENPT